MHPRMKGKNNKRLNQKLSQANVVNKPVEENSLHSEERCHLFLITSVNDLQLPLTRYKYAHMSIFCIYASDICLP